MPTKSKKAPAPRPALTRVRLDVSAEERRHLQLAAAVAGLRGMSQYVRRLVQEDMERKPTP